jgi:hypothetical protein
VYPAVRLVESMRILLRKALFVGVCFQCFSIRWDCWVPWWIVFLPRFGYNETNAWASLMSDGLLDKFRQIQVRRWRNGGMAQAVCKRKTRPRKPALTQHATTKNSARGKEKPNMSCTLLPAEFVKT